jgi:hypothetical protein
VVRFTSRLLYTLKRHSGVEKRLLPLPGIEKLPGLSHIIFLTAISLFTKVYFFGQKYPEILGVNLF